MKFIGSLILVVFGLVHSVYAGASPANEISLNLGFNRGGANFGFEYERKLEDTFGVGGYFHYFPKTDLSSTFPYPGLVTLGGSVSEHFTHKKFDFSLTPGFGLVILNSPFVKPGNTTTVGPSLALNAMWNVSPTIAIGAEAASYFIWFSDWPSPIATDLLLKATHSF